MSHITPHESDADLFTIEDVEHDFVSLKEALIEKKIENLVRELLSRSEVLTALQNIVASGHFANEVEALAQAIQTLQFEVHGAPRARVSS